MTPAVVRSKLEDQLRSQPGYIEKLERDAASPEGISPQDWRTGTL
ncbi:hypothetical protein [Mycolicibacillus koreensis]|nr:hypothetical protein [Mycolicibacillus koreensis]BBY54050.1 hypothetical protein MKOR_13010 [Mycolicibacillus koreensis]